VNHNVKRETRKNSISGRHLYQERDARVWYGSRVREVVHAVTAVVYGRLSSGARSSASFSCLMGKVPYS